MKKILFIIIIIISYNIILSQNLVDPPKLSNFTNINTNIYDVSFNNNNFILGWNWASTGQKLDSALNINYYHQYIFNWDNQNTFLGDNNYIYGHRKVVDLIDVTAGHSCNWLNLLKAQAQLLSPALIVDTTEKFIPLPNDNMGGVFGFKTKIDGYQDGNYWVLDNNILPNTMVLSNIWKNNILKYWNC